jgi:hypothetical protein
LGASIIGPIEALKAWSESHIDEIDAARRAYDGQTGGAEQTAS